MTEVKRKMKVEKTFYMASDGHEFLTKQECLSHEQKLRKGVAEEIASKLPHFELSPDWADDDCAWHWYYIPGEAELNAVREALYERDACAWEYVPSSFPCWLAFVEDYEGYGYIVGTPMEVADSMNKFVECMAQKLGELVFSTRNQTSGKPDEKAI